MREPRPHRPERSAEEAAAELRADVKAGRYDADAVEAVLGAAGHRVPRRREGPAGLTPREVEVLRLLARGLSNKEIAERLVISPKTVANHAEHIYAKIDASTRAAAGLFAMQHGLLPEEEFPARRPGLSRRQPACIACMFFIITASVLRSSSAGLNMHDLGAGLVLHRDVAGRRVEGVAGLEDLLAVGEAKGHPAVDHVAPVRALAAVVRKPLHQRRRVDVLAERREVHRVALELARTDPPPAP